MGPGLGRPGKNGGNQTSIITAPVSPRATRPPEKTYTEKVHAAIRTCSGFPSGWQGARAMWVVGRLTGLITLE